MWRTHTFAAKRFPDGEWPGADFADNVEAAIASGYPSCTNPLAPRYFPERFEASALHEGDN